MAPRASAAKVVVLDDDPTGTQTVSGLPVLTEWSVDALAAELRASGSCFYILTNSRALSDARARAVAREIGANLRRAGELAGRSFNVVSRADSTLRGHFPAETDALAEGLGEKFDATVLVPAFFDGGRITVGDVHYVAEADALVPAGETEFARDAAFGYRASNLREWVEEKTDGRVPAARVVSVPLATLRRDLAAVATLLCSLSGGAIVVVNAAVPDDLNALTRALAVAQGAGKRFLFRTAASFVSAYAGIPPRPLPSGAEFKGTRGTGGLLVVGSHVGRTSRQLDDLFQNRPVSRVELAVEKILGETTRQAEIACALQAVTAHLQRGETTVLYTSRRVVPGRARDESLRIGESVSRSLVEILAALPERPRWLVAKGGITSSDLATRALGVRRAWVLGQALPGVPVWQLGAESRWPGLTYVIFPGNVGGDDALRRLLALLSG